VADPISKSDSESSGDDNREVEHVSSRPFLRMRPKHFFSNKFDMDIVEDHSIADARKPRNQHLNRLMDLNLFLMIIVVGVPMLVYCIIGAAT
jgi:hypothetical protein